MFVPSLSWQNGHFHIQIAQKDAFSYLHARCDGVLRADLIGANCLQRTEGIEVPEAHPDAEQHG
jgi:hypothetical protein